MREIAIQIASAFFIGVILDCLFADPPKIPHSINLIGNSIKNFENFIRKRLPNTPKGKRTGGLLTAIVICSLSATVPAAILICLYKLDRFLCIAVHGLMMWQIIAAKSLMIESKKVYDRLKDGSIEDARKALSMIVGRNTEELTEEGVIKAAVETVAENTSDGVTAPMLFLFIGGAPLGYLYKAINTMDSLLGYKNEKYVDFGRYPAKLDDLANFIPSRLTAISMITASYFLGYDAKNAVKIFRRDRLKHASPNSAQTESVCAGALDIRLAGDIKYFGVLHKKDYIGDPLREIEPCDILKSHKLMYGSAAVFTVLFCVIWAVIIF